MRRHGGNGLAKSISAAFSACGHHEALIALRQVFLIEKPIRRFYRTNPFIIRSISADEICPGVPFAPAAFHSL